jgi:glycosyltransferase involved in cell wall biosynthesis
MIIFVTEQPYTFNLNGAAALSSSHLRFLAKKFPEKTIKIFFLNKNTVFWRESPDFDNSKIEVTLIDIPSTEFKILNLSSLRLIFESKIDYLAKEIFEFDSNFSQKISILQTFKNKAGLIDFIWCEHLIPVTYLFLILPIELISDKLIYSHHDFLFKILWKRAKSSKQIARFFLVRKLELMLLRKVTHFVTGSQFEFKQIQEINPRAKINFLPCFYPPMGSSLVEKNRK